MRRTGVLAIALALAWLVAICAGAGPAVAATPPITTYFNQDAQGHCPTYGDLEICSGEVPSFDGSKLDVDLTKPAANTGGAHPLILMFHGFGNTKHEWESTTDEGDGADKWHWNSHWFAKHGYYVLTYTARGFRGTMDPRRPPYQPPTPSFSSLDPPSGTIHLKSREFEIRDSQWLAALVADAYPAVDADRVAVTGGSYGGGESWLQASQASWTFPHSQDPELPILQLQAAVPKYPWTDLGYALAPNGHGGGPSHADLYESSQGEPDNDSGDGNPFGVAKISFITGLTALGSQRGLFEQGTTTTPSEEGPINIPAWQARGAAGEPYDVAGAEDPIMRQIRRGLTEFRASYYQDEGWLAQKASRRVAVFSIQGWTDDLFEAIESFRQFKYLKRLDPQWPVELALADVGHSRSQNKPETWRRLNAQAWQWLQSNINGSHDQQTTVSSEPTICANDSAPGTRDAAAERVTATSPEGLSAGKLVIRYSQGGTLNHTSGAGDPNGPATDPVVTDEIPSGEPCRTSPGPAAGAYTAVSQPAQASRTYVGLGYVEVPYTLEGTTATVNARVWDVPPNGKTLLITRGTYRLDLPAYDAPAGTLRLPLFGNHWDLRPGHSVRLDLTAVDSPFLRPSTLPAKVIFAPPTLHLPTRQAGTLALLGS
jgi:dienelactone hydrolase